MIVFICTLFLLTKNTEGARYQDTHQEVDDIADLEEQLERSVEWDKETWKNTVRQYLLLRRESLQVRFRH